MLNRLAECQGHQGLVLSTNCFQMSSASLAEYLPGFPACFLPYVTHVCLGPANKSNVISRLFQISSICSYEGLGKGLGQQA